MHSTGPLVGVPFRHSIAFSMTSWLSVYRSYPQLGAIWGIDGASM